MRLKFGVRRLVAALISGDLSPLHTPPKAMLTFQGRRLEWRQVATNESGDKSPHSKILPLVNRNDVWEEASLQNPTRDFSCVSRFQVSTEIQAHIINGQMNNEKLLKDFINKFSTEGYTFVDAWFLWASNFLPYLKPEVFEFQSPCEIECKTWFYFFKALRNMRDQSKANNFLIRSTLHLFNDPDFSSDHWSSFSAMSKNQMRVLPIDDYKKPEIRLLLACLTDRLDDHMIDTANSLGQENNKSFFKFFINAYDAQSPRSADLGNEYVLLFTVTTKHLKNLLLWLLNRPSIDPVKSTWDWINIHHASITLRLDDIQKDNEIQGHIRRLGLTVKKT